MTLKLIQVAKILVTPRFDGLLVMTFYGKQGAIAMVTTNLS